MECKWQNVMSYFLNHAVSLPHETVNAYTTTVKQLIREIKFDDIDEPSTSNVLEWFYFKMGEFERLGRQHDHMQVSSEVTKYFKRGEKYQINYLQYTKLLIPRNIINDIIIGRNSCKEKRQYEQLLLSLAFGKKIEHISPKEKKRFKSALTILNKQIALLDEHIINNPKYNFLPIIKVAACVQETLRSKKQIKCQIDITNIPPQVKEVFIRRRNMNMMYIEKLSI